VDGYPSFIIATTIRIMIAETTTPNANATRTVRTPAAATIATVAKVTAVDTAERAADPRRVGEPPPVATQVTAAVARSTNKREYTAQDRASPSMAPAEALPGPSPFPRKSVVKPPLFATITNIMTYTPKNLPIYFPHFDTLEVVVSMDAEANPRSSKRFLVRTLHGTTT